MLRQLVHTRSEYVFEKLQFLTLGKQAPLVTQTMQQSSSLQQQRILNIQAICQTRLASCAQDNDATSRQSSNLPRALEASRAQSQTPSRQFQSVKCGDSTSNTSTNNALPHQSADFVRATLPPAYARVSGLPSPFSQVGGECALGYVSRGPPTYDDVTNPNAQPPSYASMFGQMQLARKESRDALSFAKRLVVIVISTVGLTLCAALMFAIPLLMIAVGVAYFNSCPAGNIPLALIVNGVLLELQSLNIFFGDIQRTLQASNELTTFHAFQQQSPPPQALQLQQQQTMSTRATVLSLFLLEEDRRDLQRKRRRRFELLLNTLSSFAFAFCLFVVCFNYKPEMSNPRAANYCHKTAFSFAFWYAACGFGSVMAIMVLCVTLLTFEWMFATLY